MINKNGAYRPFNYAIKNASEETAIIDIDGFIGRDIWEEWMTGEPSPNTIERLKKQLRTISSSKIIVNINSPGGDLNDGLLIKDMLQQKNAEIITNLQGFSASAATVIAQAGTTRRMSENAFQLVHRVMFGIMGYYNQNSFRDMIADCEVIDNNIIKMYAKRSTKSEEEITTLMDEGGGYGRWLDPEEALEMGLIDEIYDPTNESDQNVDRLTATEQASMKRNVQELAIQGVLSTEEMAAMVKNLKNITNKEASSAKEARTRATILKLTHEV